LGEYFEFLEGQGILATIDKDDIVNLTMFASPYFLNDSTVMFIRTERLTHETLKSNSHAAYLISEEEQKYQGKSLYLRQTKEEKYPDSITQICPKYDYSHYETKNRSVIYFNFEKVQSLIGTDESDFPLKGLSR
jgi:hypothetical protein